MLTVERNSLPDQPSLLSQGFSILFSRTTFVVAACGGGIITIIAGLVLGGLFFPQIANGYYVVLGYLATPLGGGVSLAVGGVILNVSVACITLKSLKSEKESPPNSYTVTLPDDKPFEEVFVSIETSKDLQKEKSDLSDRIKLLNKDFKEKLEATEKERDDLRAALISPAQEKEAKEELETLDKISNLSKRVNEEMKSLREQNADLKRQLELAQFENSNTTGGPPPPPPPPELKILSIPPPKDDGHSPVTLEKAMGQLRKTSQSGIAKPPTTEADLVLEQKSKHQEELARVIARRRTTLISPRKTHSPYNVNSNEGTPEGENWETDSGEGYTYRGEATTKNPSPVEREQKLSSKLGNYRAPTTTTASVTTLTTTTSNEPFISPRKRSKSQINRRASLPLDFSEKETTKSSTTDKTSVKELRAKFIQTAAPENKQEISRGVRNLRGSQGGDHCQNERGNQE